MGGTPLIEIEIGDASAAVVIFQQERGETMRTKCWPITIYSFFISLAFLGLTRLHAQHASPIMPDTTEILTKQFATGKVCAMCHSSASSARALRDAQNRPIGPHDLWRSTMMAHSTADPLWRAVFAAEVAANPTRQAEIETKCLRCHAPMASVEAMLTKITPSRDRFLSGNSTLASLAVDGVSCTICHQLPADQLGTDATFSGQFQIGTQKEIYGPHARPFMMPMFRHTGYTPTEGQHIRDSELCASCHTLFTHALASDGSDTGHTLLEQGPYLEWQNSEFNAASGDSDNRAASCQDCHVPTTDADGQPIKTRIARNPHGWDFPPVRPRSPFGRHVFVGGNTLVPTMLRAQHADNHSKEIVSHFDRAIEANRELLQHKTARIEIAGTKFQGNALHVDISVQNQAGHKLPTAYPSRRVWIRLQISDADGQVVFASGQFDDRGRLLDGEQRVLPSELIGGPVVPHYETIESSAQVQVYESIMQDANGEVTYSLLRGAAYHKDNRLLPRGWKPDHRRGQLTTPVAIDGDRDFLAGKDVTKYIIRGLSGRAPFQVEASLCYQVLGSRYAAELLACDVPEMKEFAKLYAGADPRPELLGRTEATVKPKGDGGN
jgi:hypothetical protein